MASNRDYNTHEPEPRVPASERPPVPNPANPQAVPADLAHLIPPGLSGAQAEAAVAALRQLGLGTTGRGFLGTLPTSAREVSSGMSEALQKLDASRLARQCNGGGTLQGGSKS
jgi:hypothetical protein